MNYIEVEKKIFQTLFILRNYPQMLIQGGLTYVVFQNYLQGYTYALEHCLGIDVGKKITWWFQEKINQKTSFYWTTHIADYYKDRSEGERISILIDVVEVFFQENPNWYLQE